MKNPVIIIAAILSFAITSCKTIRLNPDRPAPGDLVHQVDLKPSEIVVPFTVNLENLTKLINENLPSGEIASGSGKDGHTKKYSYSVHRNQPVMVSAYNNEIVFQVPLKIVAHGSYTACIGYWRNGDCCSAPRPWPFRGCFPGITSTEHGDASPTVFLNLRVGLAIDSAYNVSATTYLDASIGGDTHLHIDLIGNLIRINIDIKDKLAGPLHQFVADYQDDINHKVGEMIASTDVKKQLEKYWIQLQEPVRKDFAFINFHPRDVLFQNLKVDAKALTLAIGLRGQLEISDKPHTEPVDSLPPLKLITEARPSFHVYLPVGASFSMLDSLLNRSVTGKKFKKDNDWVVIHKVTSAGIKLGEGSAILTVLDITAKAKGIRAKGKLYFTSIPAIDTLQRVAYVQDFMLTPSTNSLLVNKGVPFLINNFYYKDIKDQMEYSYAAEVDKYLRLANEYVGNLQVGPVTIKGEVTSITTDGFIITPERLRVIIAAKGKFEGSIILE
jgi:hypothetical protein